MQNPVSALVGDAHHHVTHGFPGFCSVGLLAFLVPEHDNGDDNNETGSVEDDQDFNTNA